MTIKRKLYSSAVASIVLMIISIGAVVLASIEVEEANQNRDLAEGVLIKVSDLGILTNQYLLNRRESSVGEWNTQYNSVAKILIRADKKETATMRLEFVSIGDLFLQVTRNYKRTVSLTSRNGPQEEIDAVVLFETNKVSQLLASMRSIISDASILSEIATSEARSSLEFSNKFNILSLLLLGIVITTTSFLVVRSISKPLDELTKGTQIIGQGDLDYRTGIKSRDEIGLLSAAFDHMTENLSAMQDERKQAEESERSKAAEVTHAYERLKGTQAQLVQAGKMAGLGQIGAGIAHELNQPITSIQGFAQRIRRDISGKAIDEMDIIINATHRMARIVDNIRTFARQDEFKLEPIDPLEPLDNALMLISEQLRLHEVEVQKTAEETFPPVLADTVRLEQVFMNLLSNALDALDQVEEGNPKRLLLAIAMDGDQVAYTIEDNGPGVPEDNEGQIFDPFFTTKPPGQGTGLGLSLSYGIVSDHGGEITYQSSASGGARFTVRIPVVVESSEDGSERGFA